MTGGSTKGSDAGRVRVGSVEELAAGDVRLVEVAGHRVCLARTSEGEVFAVDDICTHEDESLSEGWLDRDCIECPAHNSVFDLRTGEAKTLPATEPVATYPVDLEGDDIFVTLPTPD